MADNAYQECCDNLVSAMTHIREARHAAGGDYIGLDLEDLKLLDAMDMRCGKMFRQVDEEAVKQ